MNVGEFFTLLSYGELSNLIIGGEGSGEIPAEHHSRILTLTQHALKGLYSRFAHKIDYVTLRQVEGLHRYDIRKTHAVTDATVGNTSERYLIDSALEPFPGEVVKIVSVRPIHEEYGLQKDLLINDVSDESELKALSYDQLYFVNPEAGKEFLLEVQLNHPKLTIPANRDEDILLAPVLESALSYKVASRIYSSMNGAENISKAAILDAQYEGVCNLVTLEDLLQVGSTNQGDRFQMGGWI